MNLKHFSTLVFIGGTIVSCGNKMGGGVSIFFGGKMIGCSMMQCGGGQMLCLPAHPVANAKLSRINLFIAVLLDLENHHQAELLSGSNMKQLKKINSIRIIMLIKDSFPYVCRFFKPSAIHKEATMSKKAIMN